MADILISHANGDNERIRALVKLLTAKDWTVWWNKEITPGEAADMTTEAELEKASVVITVWSKHSVQSRLVRNTAFEAIESHRWLPVLFDFVRPPLRYRHYQSIPMAGWPDQERSEAERSILKCCQRMLSNRDLARSPTSIMPTLDNGESESRLDRNSVMNGSSALATKFATIRLNEWTIEEGQNRISRGNLSKKVTPRSMQVLMYLLENGRAPTSIERILSHVWRDRVVVESVVHRCISELREALEDDFREPRYIETITKRGYRIVASISELGVRVDA